MIAHRGIDFSAWRKSRENMKELVACFGAGVQERVKGEDRMALG